MTISKNSIKTMSQREQLNNLKAQLSHWRQERAQSGPIPHELKQKILALHLSGVPAGRFQALGISHTQIQNWLSRNKVPEKPQEHAITFAKVEEPKNFEKTQPTAINTQPPSLDNAPQSIPINFSVKQGMLELSIACSHTDVAKTLLKTILECLHAATHTTS